MGRKRYGAKQVGIDGDGVEDGRGRSDGGSGECGMKATRYDTNGKVVRGPAPLSLALAHVDVDEDAVLVKQWSETDFRTNENPWWA